jgi:hypothetical protein
VYWETVEEVVDDSSGFRTERSEREVGLRMTGSTAAASSRVEHEGHKSSPAYVDQTPVIALIWILIARHG